MSRFLFVVPPLHGHTVPTLELGAELGRRGHQVAWVGYRDLLDRQLPPDAVRFAASGAESAAELARAGTTARSLSGLAALKFLSEGVLIPMARAMLPGVRRAVDEYGPHVLVVDHQAIAGALVARERQLRWASSCTSGAERHRDLAGLPKVLEWSEAQLRALWQETIGSSAMPPAVELSPHCVLAYTTASLFGPTDALPVPFHFVGPVVGARPAVPFPWSELRPGPRVYLSLGTVNPESGARFYAAAKAALGDLPLQVIATAPDEFLPFPANFLVRPFVPQLEVLRHVDAVVTHGGHNTMLESLSLGLPLVVAPIKDDQLINAQRLVELGAGIRLSFRRPRPPEIRAAVLRALQDPALRAAARRIQADLTAAGGGPRAAALLEALSDQ